MSSQEIHPLGEAEDAAVEEQYAGSTHLVDWITGRESDLNTARTDRAVQAVSAERGNAQADAYAFAHTPEHL